MNTKLHFDVNKYTFPKTFIFQAIVPVLYVVSAESLDRDRYDPNVIIWFVCLGVGLHVADVLHYLHPFHHAAEYCVLVV